ncbi:MAG TPA: DNA-directed RNA polymerase subunit omega [bacterium]|nr:DNA-directed RNA polymerase subunit omega [bacterium]
MKKTEYAVQDFRKKIANKYAAAIIVSSRAKQIRENPADVDEKLRKLKPTVSALREFLEDKVKYPEYDLDKINIEE